VEENKMTDYQDMRRTYERLLEAIPNQFQLEDTGSSYLLNHQETPLTIELEGDLESEVSAHVNLMSPLLGENNPESMISNLQDLIERRDSLRQRGYQERENFQHYESGVEIVYDILLADENDIMQLITDFSNC
jgi:hypothetical protein